MFNCYNAANKSAIARKILAYIDSTGIDAFPGGVPTTLMQTGEQWDYPNAWAPLQQWLSEGLRTLDDKEATDLANKWTNRNDFCCFFFWSNHLQFHIYFQDGLFLIISPIKRPKACLKR